MTTASLTQDIHDLSLEVLVSEAGDEKASLAAALRKLAQFIEQAAQAGATTVVANASRLVSNVTNKETSVGPESAMAALLDGLKSLETEVSKAEADVKVAASSNQAKPSAIDSLADDPELLQDFVVEASEHLSVMETQLLALEQNPDEAEPTHACFRAIHTIKGLAGFLELNAIREVAHEGETLLDAIRNRDLKAGPSLIDALLKAADFLRGEVKAIEKVLGGAPKQAPRVYAPVLKELQAAGRPSTVDLPVFQADSTPTVTPKKSTPSLPPINVHVSVDAVEVSASTEKSVSVVAPAPKPSPSPTQASGAGTWQGGNPGSRTVKIEMEKLDYLADMVGELVVAQSMLRPEGNGKLSTDSTLLRNLAQLARITAEVQKTTMSMRMVPIGQMFQRLTRLVRDVSRQVGKAVELEVSGEEIEMDRSIVEELADPLLHMVRNSIDHGIETVAERKQAGKDVDGRIRLKAKHDAGHVQIEISDDGRGLDRDKIIAKARERGLIDAHASLSETVILNLIFEPGFSTAEKVTDLSGRGVGMDVVRKQVQKLRGSVDVRSTPGEGTIFVLRLPLTLAIIDGLVIGIGTERYIVPIAAVKEVLRPTEDMIFTVASREEMVMVRNSLMPLIRLHRWLGVKPRSENLSAGILVVIESHGKCYCLAVDDLLGKQEVVIKSLGELMQNVPGVAGGAILGDGRIGLILEPDAIAAGAARE